LVHTAEAVKTHRFHGIARGHNPRFGMEAGGTAHDLTQATGIDHTCATAQLVEDLTPIGGWQGRLLARGDAIDP
jgi:hypothetical protein